MQLIWLSGPTARVVTLSITRKTIFWFAAGLAAMFFLLGAALQLLGLRVAIEVQPELARKLGAVTTASEQERIESAYQEQLQTLEQKIQALNHELSQLEATKRQLVELVPQRQVRPGPGGQGGPLHLLSGFEWFAPRATEKLQQMVDDALRLESRVSSLNQQWAAEVEWLGALPIQSPILGEYRISSGFGLRRDPFTRALSRHEGVDYVAPVGTPIVATAPGTVLQARYWGAYGLMVDIEHEWGFVTRYAHLSRILVKQGDTIQTGQTIGLLGNTGRSTGPHLHYEVRFRDKPLNPTPDHVIRTARQNSVFPAIQLAQQ